MVWLCDQEPVRTFQKGPPPEKAKLRRWWTYLSQLRLTVHHIQGVKNECADYISRNNLDALIGAQSEALAKEAFSVILVSIYGGDIGEVTHTPHFCKKKSTKVPECTRCTMEVTRYNAKAKFKSTSELLIT